jgi:hypothetical protein
VDNTVEAQGQFSVFFAQEVDFVPLHLQANGEEDPFLLKEDDDFSWLHPYSFLTFPGKGKEKGQTSPVSTNITIAQEGNQ